MASHPFKGVQYQKFSNVVKKNFCLIGSIKQLRIMLLKFRIDNKTFNMFLTTSACEVCKVNVDVFLFHNFSIGGMICDIESFCASSCNSAFERNTHLFDTNTIITVQCDDKLGAHNCYPQEKSKNIRSRDRNRFQTRWLDFCIETFCIRR